MLSIFKLTLYSLGMFNESINNYVSKMNNDNLTYKLELYDFKYKSSENKFIPRSECYNCYIDDEYVQLPESVDWRNENAVTIVKNQGDCGSCWSFSKTSSIEGAWEIKYNKLYNLPEQMLIDCSGKYGNKDCEGELMDNGFKYVIDNGLCSENDYPYRVERDFCKSGLCKIRVKVIDYSDVKSNDEYLLKKAVEKQSVSVAI